MEKIQKYLIFIYALGTTILCFPPFAFTLLNAQTIYVDSVGSPAAAAANAVVDDSIASNVRQQNDEVIFVNSHLNNATVEVATTAAFKETTKSSSPAIMMAQSVENEFEQISKRKHQKIADDTDNDNDADDQDSDDDDDSESDYIEEEAVMEKDIVVSRNGEKLLSRKRRYLIFPEGSSFQMVWDGIIGVVDFTNYLILGITVALAWELPSKPPSEIVEDLKQRLEDGTLGLRRNDTVANITYLADAVEEANKNPTQKKQNSHNNNLATTTTAQRNYNRNYYNNNIDNSVGYKSSPSSSSSSSSSHYNSYYTSNKIQPAFQPPMHPKYSYNNYNRQQLISDSYYRQKSPAASPTTMLTSSQGGKTTDYHTYRQHNAPSENDWRRKDSYYYYHPVNSSKKQQHPFIKWTTKQQQQQKHATTSTLGTFHKETFRPQITDKGVGGVKYPWWNLATRLRNALHSKSEGIFKSPSKMKTKATANGKYQKNQQQGRQQAPNSGYYQSTEAIPKHRIYPVFGKRSIPSDAKKNNNNNSTTTQHHRQRRSGIAEPEHKINKVDRIHIRHHRSSRQDLYEKIEKYLDKRGSNGHHCVLRALCETGQKSNNDDKPGSFVGELMRAVFTLPEAIEDDNAMLHYKAQRYDTANAFDGNCELRYHLCKDSLWTSKFVM